ncbi:FkbM family methyltransferase [Candidatus Kaiserbacteria bacterium]|nr:FkbM family methyltransferase [Candidatus Kaiserbacteria bacterium]
MLRKIKSLIPPSFVYSVTHWKQRIFGFGKKFYSQNGEDAFLMEVAFPHQKKGFYVDVGAYHPMIYSNTYALHKRGWHGINIDPNTEAMRLFRTYRRKDINLTIGIGNAGVKEYHRYDLAGGNTFSQEQKENLDRQKYMHYLGSERVECFPIKDVLKKYAPASIDLLTVDVETLDLEVLKTNDWDTYRPRVVIAEDASFSPATPDSSEIYAFMRSKGYKLRAFLGFSLVFETQ